MTDEPKRFGRDVWIGIGLTVLYHMVNGTLISVLSVALPYLGLVLAIIAELAYIILLVRYARRAGHKGLIVGMVIVYALTLLLVAACFGIVFLLATNWNR